MTDYGGLRNHSQVPDPVLNGGAEMRFFSFLFLLTVLFIFSCTAPPAEEAVVEVGVKALSSEDVAAIGALGPAFNNACLAETFDVDAVMEMFTEDLLMMPPNLPVIKGRSAYKAWLEPLGVKFSEANYEFNEIAGYGDMAYAIGTYKETFSLKDVDGPIEDEGKILTILRKQPDGSWLFAYWMWASDLPLPE